MKNRGWDSVSFEELVEFHDQRRIPLSKKERSGRPGPFPYYGAQGIIDRVDDYIFDGRYLLIAEDGENLRSRKQPVAYMADGQFWVNNHAHVVKAVRGVADDDFLRAYVEFHPLGGLITGAAQPKLSQASLKRLAVAAPPYAVQTRIGEAVRVVDGLLQNNRRRIEILEEIARLLYREWFVHFRYPGHEEGELIDSDLGPIPESWGITTLGDAARWLSGGTPDTREPAYWGGEIPWITSGSLTSFMLDHSDRTLTQLGVDNGSRIVARNTTLFVVRGMSLAKEFRHGVADIPLAFGQDCKALIAKPGIEPLFLALSVSSLADDIQGMVEFAAHGTGKLSTDRIQALTIPHPPEPIQQRFVGSVEPMMELMSNLRGHSRVLRKARDLLLPRLVSGELDVSELDLGLVAV